MKKEELARKLMRQLEEENVGNNELSHFFFLNTQPFGLSGHAAVWVIELKKIELPHSTRIFSQR